MVNNIQEFDYDNYKDNSYQKGIYLLNEKKKSSDKINL